MANMDDLNNIHNKYNMNLEQIEKDKTIYTAELDKVTEQMDAVKNVIRYSELNNVFEKYVESRDRIGRIDMTWIAALQSYINDITEIAEKIAQEVIINNSNSPKKIAQAMENVELDEQGTPHFVKPFQFDAQTIPKPLGPPISNQAVKPTSNKGDSIKATLRPGDQLTEGGVYPLRNYPPEERIAMIEKAYIETPKGIRTSVNVFRKWKGLYPSVAMSRKTIYNWCKKLNLQVEGEVVGENIDGKEV
jgi:hypothetical protein